MAFLITGSKGLIGARAIRNPVARRVFFLSGAGETV